MKYNSSTLRFQVSYEQKPELEIPLAGFLFYCNEIFLQSQLVRDNILEFSLKDATHSESKVSNIDTRQLRVFIAPVSEEDYKNITSLEQLESYKPYEPVLSTDAQGNFNILPIPSVISRFWPFCTCRVTGKVSKWFHVGSSWEDREICNARVHICDIDTIWYWIYRIPDPIIAKIPSLFLNPEQIVKFPIPIPDPSPIFEENIQVAKATSQNIFGDASTENEQSDIIAKLPELSADIKQNLASGNLNLIRETITNYYTTLHPWFCLIPWLWPYFYRCRELAVVYTDASGRFDTNVTYNCFGDKPDIYIWVEYLINGVWTTVYGPPIPCNTLWNYICGSNINVQITDDRVPGNCCCDCPMEGEIVWIRSVGSTSVAHINQPHVLQAPDGQLATYDRIGLTDASAIYDDFLTTKDGDFKRPFGGSPSLYMGFGSDLPNSGIYYYRWSYKQVANAQLGAPATIDTYKPLVPIGGSVTKGYEYEYLDSHGDTQFAPNSVTLGPLTVGGNDNLYIIPPTSPDMAPFNAPESNPQWWEPTYNMNTITFDSTQLKNGSTSGGDGLYEFKLELFDQAGNLLTSLPKATFKTPEYSDSNYSENAPDQLLENPTATTADAFNILMRIDNSKCKGGIYKVKVNGSPASSDCCGFVGYKPNGVEATLGLSFLATHPNNFGVFSFGVVRGTCGDVPVADATGMVIDSTYSSLSPVHYSYKLNGLGVYHKHFTPAELLGSCYDNGNGKAAFAETLYVIAMATDGTFRVTANDATYVAPLAYPVAAFALEP
jgi:hypothetical protein